MPHVPQFPPTWRDFGPGNPFELEPPLPRFLWNPLTPEQRAALEEEFGKWASARTLGMLSPRETYETTRAVARSVYEPFKARALAWALPAPPTPRRVRREKVPTIAAVGVLTPEIEEKLVDDLTEHFVEIRERHRRKPITEEKIEAAKMTKDWAEDVYNVSITANEAGELVRKALARFAPART